MGEGDEGLQGVAVLVENADVSDDMIGDAAEPENPEHILSPSPELAAGRRRYTIAVIAAIVAASVPFLWILWSLWGPTNPLRLAIYQTNFYDLQARAIEHGHLWLPNGSIGIEAFVHDGRQYTYFGLFPSLIRIPILTVTNSLYAKMTAPFILLSWLLTGLFASLLLWRVRVLTRGQEVMGWTEAVSFGVLMATIMCGSIFLLLAATPYVFNEDLAWSICLTIGSIFTLLGVLERPSWGRVIASFALVMAANLDRATTGWACVFGAVMIAAWFGMGRAGVENRRWFVPVLVVGLVPLLVSCAVNYAKFGIPFGVPVVDQVWTSVNAYRREFLAANHNSEVGIAFIPSNVLAYLRPDGLRFTPVFPFITLPSSPATALAGVLFDKRYRTASVTSSTPLLVLLSCWGLVTAFRPRPIGEVRRTRILLLAAGSAGAALLLWGYIAPRYLADFVPFLVLASAVAMADIWRRLEARRRSIRFAALGIITVVALFTIAANIGISITPNEEWNTTQALHYVEAQKAVSDITGVSLKARIRRGNSLPPWGPADQLYVVGDCDGLYISNGENYSTVPSQQFGRMTWMTVELGHGFEHSFDVTFSNRLGAGGTQSLPLITVGPTVVSINAAPTSHRGRILMYFSLHEHGRSISGRTHLVQAGGTTHRVIVITDPVKHEVIASLDGVSYLTDTLAGGPITVDSTYAGSEHTTGLRAVNDTDRGIPEPTLCESLIH